MKWLKTDEVTTHLAVIWPDTDFVLFNPCIRAKIRVVLSDKYKRGLDAGPCL